METTATEHQVRFVSDNHITKLLHSKIVLGQYMLKKRL